MRVFMIAWLKISGCGTSVPPRGAITCFMRANSPPFQAFSRNMAEPRIRQFLLHQLHVKQPPHGPYRQVYPALKFRAELRMRYRRN